jgi:hypothetical protein
VVGSIAVTVLNFCLHSIFREYGWQFIRRVAAPHPVRTAKAFLQAGKMDVPGYMIRIPGPDRPDERWIVSLGFCLKPMDPLCPAGRANHNCLFFEQMTQFDSTACRNCLIREFGNLTLKAGSAFYIMTSALDILLDVFEPALREDRFTSGLFVLCRYSVEPFAVGMLASRIRGRMFRYNRGDCRDYKTWLLADRGIKNEQTEIIDSTRATISEILKNASKRSIPAARFKKRGNIFFAD